MLATSVGLAGVLLLAASATVAKPSDTDEDAGWCHWEGLAPSLAGRRRVAPKQDQPVWERRLDTTELRHTKARRALNALRHAEVTGNSKAKVKDKIKDKKAKNKGSKRQERTSDSWVFDDAQTGEVTFSTATLMDASLLEPVLTPTQPVNAAWMRTGTAGLYAVSIADLALGMGQTERKIRNKAKRGALSLTTAPHATATTANQARAWYFDMANDQLLFAAEAYETFHTDENAHRLYFSKAKALPMTVANGAPTPATGLPTPFRDTLVFERELGCDTCIKYDTSTLAQEPDADYWFWDYLWAGFRDDIQVALQIPDPASNGTAQLRVRLRGWTDLDPGNDHSVSAELNGNPLWVTVTWDGLAEAVLVADVDQALLQDGNNTLTLRSEYVGDFNTGQYLDDVELDYDRQPVAYRVDDDLPADAVLPREDEGVLWLHDVAAGVQTVAAFDDDTVLVIQDPAGSAVLRQDARVESDADGGWQVVFAVEAASDFLVLERAAIAAPSIAPDYPLSPNLHSKANQADYLVLYAPEFQGTAEALAGYRALDYDIVKTVNLEEIYERYSAGREDPAAITKFMQRVRQWSVVPVLVTVIGKGTLDHKDRTGYGDSFFPVRLTDNPWALAPSDDRLLGGGADAPFAIGRLSITSDDEGLLYVQKLADYEASGPAGERNAVAAADNPDEGGDFHFSSGVLAERLVSEFGFSGVTKLYHPADEVSTSLADPSTWETEYVSYSGHGSAFQLGNGSEDFMLATTAQALTNTALPILTTLTCASGNDAIPGIRSIAGELVFNPNGHGVIAAIVSTGASLDAEAQTLGNALVGHLFDDTEPATVGGALQAAKADTSGSIQAFMPRIYTVLGEPGVRAR
jgi:hypothetical protein